MTEPTSPVPQDPLTRVPATPFPDFRSATVTAEWLDTDTKLPCYHDTTRWNGWGMPYFTLEAGNQLATLMPNLRFVQERDAFVHTSEEDGEEVLDFIGQVIEVDGQRIKAYAIGAGYWCWDYPE
ncbi:MAG: hypothetical protein Q8S92_15505 [Hydrogenophaga sp.]|uniref:hypothetical protein n=1 Tax=Hydrogenophaga sp. TaxID=1904254 RepID=UPI0027339B6C|nr:hypothetical protein [Hydrogenophaga sp.]MDP3350396.1 hypothetical protein [Hydrogenophaga sp.]